MKFDFQDKNRENLWSHPTWVRGLKFMRKVKAALVGKSHPTWVRGLKYTKRPIILIAFLSHPTWVRGLKLDGACGYDPERWSHPTWVRGLKCFRHPEGLGCLRVAPHVGAWIEIVVYPLKTLRTGSHPTWVRGLKYPAAANFNAVAGRTPRGCVD